MNRFITNLQSTFSSNPEPVIPEESISQIIDFSIPNFISTNAKMEQEPFSHLMPSPSDMNEVFNSVNVPDLEKPSIDEIHEEGSAALASEELTPEAEISSAESVLEAPVAAFGMLAVSQAASFQANIDVNKDLSGQGVAGHSFGAAYQAREDQAHDSTVGLENMGLVGAGSLLGPEGTIAGLGLAAINSTFNTSPVATVQSDTGAQIPVSALND